MATQVQRTRDWSTIKTVGVWSLQVLVGLAFLAAGGSKLMGAESMVEVFDKVGVGQWFRYVTGLIEVTSAGMVLYPKTAAIGGGLLVCTMIGAALAHLTVLSVSGIVAPLVLMTLAGLVTWYRRP